MVADAGEVDCDGGTEKVRYSKKLQQQLMHRTDVADLEWVGSTAKEGKEVHLEKMAEMKRAAGSIPRPMRKITLKKPKRFSRVSKQKKKQKVRKKGSTHFRRESMASQMSVDNSIPLSSFITSKVQRTSVVGIGQRNASGIQGLGQEQANNYDGQSHSVGSVTSSTDEGRNVIDVGKILGLNFGPNENAILHHISQIEKEEIELH
ncbi:hypothetical protein MRB53_013298 [Persea americana]|uniref:Uncharacterized protein n=1 Tax=Persea americana TaxID=3435 RepID=A0ACC2K7M8_PERAE|nr:hypothetical protein MRB53_013298 [Persea americana]